MRASVRERERNIPNTFYFCRQISIFSTNTFNRVRFTSYKSNFTYIYSIEFDKLYSLDTTKPRGKRWDTSGAFVGIIYTRNCQVGMYRQRVAAKDLANHYFTLDASETKL